MIKHQTSDSRGFTIIELMIATSVFAVVLLLIATGILQIGKTYYKGVAQARTQSVARNVIDEISRGIQFSGGGSSVTARLMDPSNTTYGICINDIVYEFALDTILDPSGGAGKSQRVLLAHRGSCSGFNSGSLTNIVATPPPLMAGDVNRELLGEGMRLLELNVTGTNPYTVTVVVALVTDNNLLTGSAPYNANTLCKGGTGQEFCAVSKLETIVQKRVI